jgi:hypothetical protein
MAGAPLLPAHEPPLNATDPLVEHAQHERALAGAGLANEMETLAAVRTSDAKGPAPRAHGTATGQTVRNLSVLHLAHFSNRRFVYAPDRYGLPSKYEGGVEPYPTAY